MATTKLAPLSTQVPIVDENGNPTTYFQQLMQIFIDEKNEVADDVSELGLVNLSDVDLVNVAPVDEDLLTYEGSSELWVPQSISKTLDSITSTQGSIIYRNASGWVSLAPGTSGQFLETLGAGANPAWATVVTSSGSPYEASPVSPRPAVADFAWRNQGTALAANATDGGVIMTNTSPSVSVRMLEKSLASTPFSVYCNVRPIVDHRNNSNQAGLHIYNSTNGRLLWLNIAHGNSTGLNVVLQRWASVTSFNANIFQITPWEPVHWLRLDVTSTGVTAYCSSNGRDWYNMGTETFATYLTATGGSASHYGISASTNANPYTIWFPSFGLTAP